MLTPTRIALLNETVAFLRGQPEQAASFDRIHDHLSATIRLLNIEHEHLDLWGRFAVVRAGSVHQILARLQDASVIERVREGRAVSYALTDERKWAEPSW